MHFLHAPHQTGAQHLIGEAMTVSKREERPDVGPRQIRGSQLAAQGATDRSKSLGPASEQKAVLKQISLWKLQYSERQGNDGGVETASEKTRNEILARGFLDIKLNARRRDPQMFQDSWKQIRGKRGDYPHRNSKRALLESFPHRLEKQCLVQDPERLLMGIAAERGEKETTTLALDQPAT